MTSWNPYFSPSCRSSVRGTGRCQTQQPQTRRDRPFGSRGRRGRTVSSRNAPTSRRDSLFSIAPVQIIPYEQVGCAHSSRRDRHAGPDPEPLIPKCQRRNEISVTSETWKACPLGWIFINIRSPFLAVSRHWPEGATPCTHARRECRGGQCHSGPEMYLGPINSGTRSLHTGLPRTTRPPSRVREKSSGRGAIRACRRRAVNLNIPLRDRRVHTSRALA